MLTIRKAQFDVLADDRLERLHERLLMRVQQAFPGTVALLGERASRDLVEGCIAACRECGWTGMPTVTFAVDSAFRQQDRAAGGTPATVRAVMMELQAMELRSRLETVTSLP